MNVKLTPNQKIKVLSPEDLYKIMQAILLRENKLRRGQEHFWIVGMNNRNKILFIELVALGGANWARLGAPDLFRMAIYKMAYSCIFVHNHPSGETDPSPEDIQFTHHMTAAAKFIHINVLDHLIISEETFTSLEALGKMPDFDKHTTYELVPTEENELRKLAAEAEKLKAAQKAKEEGRKERDKEIARKMKAKGENIERIEEYTGLTKAEIKKL